jgi:hypothetical protein
VLEVYLGYLLGRSVLREKQYRDEKTQEREKSMESIGTWESYNQDSRGFDEILAQAKENARAKQNN